MLLRTRAAGKLLAAVLLCTGGGAATAAITNAQLFQWAQITYPTLFPGTPQSFPVVYQGKTFDVRAYPNGNYLGVADGRAYGLGSFTGGALQDFGDMQAFAAQVCAAVGCSANDPQGGSVNECMMPASQALVAGNSYHAVYSTPATPPLNVASEMTVDGLVDGAATFNGQAVVKSTVRTVGSAAGQTSDSTQVTYEQVGEGELIRRVGHEVRMSRPVAMETRVTYNPAYLTTEFGLQQGQSLTQSVNATTTTISGPGAGASTTGSTSIRFTFEARERITVPAGSFDTCRYRQVASNSSSYTLQWHIVGLGLPARIEGHAAGGASSGASELTSLIVNGQRRP